ncbi:MAG TPA: tyrosine-type recombinase/integrase [Acidobacteriaceae bacterium]|nr:tyrosine-type recombinase/integrase [Acidobacteriaceae bacterium]
MSVHKTTDTWSWPIDATRYDQAHGLTARERRYLTVELPSRIKFSKTRKPSLDAVQRLARPLHDVFDHIEFKGPKRRSLVFYLLEEMGRRDRALWAWTDAEWMELVECRRYDGNRIVAAAFLLRGFDTLASFPKRRHVYSCLARRVFGFKAFAAAEKRARARLQELGYRIRTLRLVPLTLAQLLLIARSPRLEDITEGALLQLQKQTGTVALDTCVVALSRLLVSEGIIDQPVRRLGLQPKLMHRAPEAIVANVPCEWARLALYWHETTTLTPGTRLRVYYRLLGVGRWLHATHPHIDGPVQWTRTLAAEAVAMCIDLKNCEWADSMTKSWFPNAGSPMGASSKLDVFYALRTFFRDLQHWEIIPRSFDPHIAFRVPRSLQALIGFDPRVLPDDVWAKLIWAGLNLTAADLSLHGRPSQGGSHYYPLPLVRALSVVWLFAGLRWNEIRRLRLECVRWQENAPGERVCLLSIPINKTSTAFTKPVDTVVGEVIESWEKERPEQTKIIDPKTGEHADYLFAYRSKALGYNYLNKVLIPALCIKAGIPNQDVRGRITSHRARSTIATQLFNAREPMSLFEVQAWLGHKNPSSTQHYAKINPSKLTKSFEKAGYFERNIRAIEVLIDQDVVRKGLAAQEAWKFFDLGHGYCTYDFFDQCPHRMACAQCSFYMAKESTRAQMLEAQTNLLRLRQEIPLSEPELAAVEDGLAAYEKLIANLADVPTPDRLVQIEAAPAMHISESEEQC